jgi:hypothetical protein
LGYGSGFQISSKDAAMPGAYQMPNGDFVSSPDQMLGMFVGELSRNFKPWIERLQQDPQSLSQIEQEVAAVCARGAGMIVVGLMAVVHASEQFTQAAERARKHFAYPLGRGRDRRLSVQMLGGFVIWLTSMYCEPGRGLFRKSRPKARGQYVELAQFGLADGVSPEVESRVARQAALCPSMKLAQQQLAREGLDYHTSVVRRMALQTGDSLLCLRTDQILQWRSGKLRSTGQLKGKRVSVQIDGGRTRIRSELYENLSGSEPLDADGLPLEDAPGRSRKIAKRKFDADWREPKLVTIYEHDDQGQMVKDSQVTIDATMEGPDAIAEITAMHLYRLGAREAQSITFVADGAPWIWDRIDSIAKAAKIPDSVKIHQVLDNCHAAHHISLALKAMGTSSQDHLPLYREQRTLLRNGQWRKVVEVLEDLCEGSSCAKEVQTEINYLRKHGEAGRLSYPHYRAVGIPLGSGSVESSIRRVINLRLKSNAMYWRQANAESMMQLRALVITDQWDERLREKRERACQEQLVDWSWKPAVYSSNSTEAEFITAQKSTNSLGKH